VEAFSEGGFDFLSAYPFGGFDLLTFIRRLSGGLGLLISGNSYPHFIPNNSG
jgi:hypothetical protein